MNEINVCCLRFSVVGPGCIEGAGEQDGARPRADRDQPAALWGRDEAMQTAVTPEGKGSLAGRPNARNRDANSDQWHSQR
jgi:hypothetical protein